MKVTSEKGETGWGHLTGKTLQKGSPRPDGSLIPGWEEGTGMGAELRSHIALHHPVAKGPLRSLWSKKWPRPNLSPRQTKCLKPTPKRV